MIATSMIAPSMIARVRMAAVVLAAGVFATFAPARAVNAQEAAAQQPAAQPPPAQEAAPPPGDEAQREQVRKEVDEALDAIRGYSVERRDEALARARTALQETDRDLRELQARSDAQRERLGDAARARRDEAMADLRERRNQLAEWTGALQHGSTQAWAEVKDGFVRSYRELADALAKAQAQFEQETAPAEDNSADERPERPR